MTFFDVKRRNRTRGLILKILSQRHSLHTGGMDTVELQADLAMLQHAVDMPVLESYLKYLEDANCIRIHTVKEYGLCMVDITNHGLNILDAIAPDNDPGIDVEGL